VEGVKEGESGRKGAKRAKRVSEESEKKERGESERRKGAKRTGNETSRELTLSRVKSNVREEKLKRAH
jgi:hypothetical protein